MQRSTLQWHAGWCQNAITNPRTSDTVCSGPLMLTPPTPPSFPPKAPTSPTGGQYPSLAGSISNVSWVNPTHLNMHCYSLSCPHLPALAASLASSSNSSCTSPHLPPPSVPPPLATHQCQGGKRKSAIQCTTEQPSTSAQINQPSRPPAAPKGQQRHRQTCVHTVTLTRGPQQQQQRQ